MNRNLQIKRTVVKVRDEISRPKELGLKSFPDERVTDSPSRKFSTRNT